MPRQLHYDEAGENMIGRWGEKEWGLQVTVTWNMLGRREAFPGHVHSDNGQWRRQQKARYWGSWSA